MAKKIENRYGKKYAKPLKTVPGQGGLKKVFDQYRSNARHRGIEFFLTMSDVRDITSKSCTYCGQEPKSIAQLVGGTNTERSTLNSKYVYNGIDRIDSGLPYILSNCTTCCKKCNYIKRDGTVRDFIEHVEKVYNYIMNGEI